MMNALQQQHLDTRAPVGIVLSVDWQQQNSDIDDSDEETFLASDDDSDMDWYGEEGLPIDTEVSQLPDGVALEDLFDENDGEELLQVAMTDDINDDESWEAEPSDGDTEDGDTEDGQDECPLCHETFTDPVSLECGHLVCEECIERSTSGDCPLC
jgi:hypothetical protein